MSGSSHSSGRVVIMDDVDWSEPTPRRRHSGDDVALAPRRISRSAVGRTVEIDFASARTPSPAARSYAHLDGDLGDLERSWAGASFAEPEVIELDESEIALEDDERTWGPRPRLLAEDAGGRRTVVITGHGSDRYLTPRRAAQDRSPAYPRHGLYADRTAMWAVLLCVILLLVAITSH